MNKPSTLQNSLMLTPLIGATDSWVTALGLWLMFIVVISAFGVSMGALRSRVVPATHLLAGVLLAAALTSCAELAAQAWSLQGHRHLGIYAGLIALQCVVLEHTGFFQSAWRDRLRLCGVFGALLVGMGLLRELLGGSFHLAALAPGGFILLGLLIAAWQAWPRPTTPH
ncbi:NADH:quinone oxidoreductase [Pseudomonas sp. TH41]|uniref:Rnf-Nqr domain containing protein n=1 Tax=Pseudomonas sp. TH41 TaxID=2796405 RepID=UPI001913780F|nr:Rnf-Nqr domain containing protein [Pseudomonas sp. TH41]MBK5356425.1 NADH:quinone oxidoreductase [Pseudomonas sp. TH41]